MALKGDLASVDLAQVFQMLALNRKVGLFCVTAPSGWRALYFEPRGVGVYCDEQLVVDRVLTQIALSGRIDEESVLEVRSHSAEHGMSLADAVLAAGVLEGEELEFLIRSELEEQVFDLFFWTEADFEFLENREVVDGRPGAVDPRFRFSVDSVIMEAARRIDEWALIRDRIQSSREIFRPLATSLEVEGLNDSEVGLLDLVDGKRSIERLIELTGHSPFLVFKGLSVLLDENLIEPVPQEDLVPLAQECASESRNQDALNLYELALVGAPAAEAMITHAEAASVCETVHQYERAGGHWRSMADLRTESGDVLEAVQALQHIIQILPTDLSARERLIEISSGRSDLQKVDIDPVAQGKELVDLYLAADEVERVRVILERLLEANPQDVDLKKQLVNVYSRCNDPRRVVELYESIADDLVARRQPIEAVKYLQKIVMIDRSRRDVSERIRSLYEMDERSRSRRRSAMLVLASLFLVCSLGVAWFFYDQSAREAFAETDRQVAQLIEEEEYGSARAQCEAFSAKFPFTLVLRDVQARVATIDSLERQEESRREQNERERERALAEQRQAYQIGYELYKSLYQDERLEDALSQLESVQSMVGEAGKAEDRLWARENQIDEQIRDLEATLSQARSLKSESDRLLREGDWKAARALRLELLREHLDTESGQNVRLPVRIESQPTGARVLTTAAGDVVELGVTPCVLEIPPGAEVRLGITLEGFRPVGVNLNSADTERVQQVLQILPTSRISFEEPVRGEISGSSDGYLVAGLRGGRIGFGRLGAETGRSVRLPGLDEFHGRAAIDGLTAYLTTREGRLQAYRIDEGRKLWELGPLAAPIQFDPLVASGRLILCDESGRITAYDSRTGNDRPEWFRRINGAIAAAPLVVDQTLWIAMADGRLFGFSVGTGDQVAQLRTGLDVSAGFSVVRGAAVVSTGDGVLAAIRLSDGETLWRVRSSTGAPLDFVRVEGETVFAATAAGEVLRIDLRSGRVDARQELSAQVLQAPLLTEDEVVWLVRREDERLQTKDLLVALTPVSLEPYWEFEEGRAFASRPTLVGGGVVVATESGQILRFR